VVAATAEAVQLLRQVRELEPEPERPQDERLLVRGQRLVDVGDGALSSCFLRSTPDLLHELEQPLALLLHEDGAEERSEEADVAAKRRGGVRHARTLRVEA